MTRALVKPSNWLLVALFTGMLLAFGFGFLTLAGGGYFVVAVAIPILVLLHLQSETKSSDAVDGGSSLPHLWRFPARRAVLPVDMNKGTDSLS